MDGDDEDYDQLLGRPRPQRSLSVMLSNPRENGVVEFLAALRDGNVDETLVEAGSRLDDVDKFGRSPLLWATTGNYVEVVKFLLQAGASVTSKGNWHALHEACKAGFTELVEVLIDAPSPVNNPTHYSGGAPWSPLHIAVRQGHLDCVKLLIRAGANVNSVNAGRHTPLHEAAYRGYDAIMLELLLRGADPHVTSNQKRTPLHEACIQGKVKTAIMLLDINSKVNATDLLRDTPLHLTLRADHAYDIAVQLTTILLQYGASPTLLGREDDMPIDIARYSNQSYCLELLEMALELPQPLTQICKVHLRKQLACHWDDIDELPLPRKLKSFLDEF
ncbi:actin- protein 3 [Desmophyllum pertusum]|uniref:Actin- protein 3 n=1 Tax=Desmophyllum pertusum TaxID=174260 RepID=A0A9X0CDD1_9CNID|nr:actin- protein 3 [Desmophyllum pertusum]